MKPGIDRVLDGGALVALVIRAGYRGEGIEFFTPPEYSQQLAYMRRPAGYRVAPHVHNRVQREVFLTQEVLLVRSGAVRLDLYGEDRRFIADVRLGAGDVVFLASGGHGIEVLEEAEIVEVKQGPFAGDADKVRFEPRP